MSSKKCVWVNTDDVIFIRVLVPVNDYIHRKLTPLSLPSIQDMQVKTTMCCVKLQRADEWMHELCVSLQACHHLGLGSMRSLCGQSIYLWQATVTKKNSLLGLHREGEGVIGTVKGLSGDVPLKLVSKSQGGGHSHMSAEYHLPVSWPPLF